MIIPRKHPTYLRNDFFTKTALSNYVNLNFLNRIERKYFNFFYSENLNDNLSEGSREHYFHFLLGYLLPLVYAQSKFNFKFFLVVDCGPLMTPILRQTLQRLNFKFDVVHLSNSEKPYYTEPWDFAWNDKNLVKFTVKKVSDIYLDYSCEICQQKNLSHNLLIKRSLPHSYYLYDSEIKGYGTTRRAIENWQEISNYLFSKGIDHLIYEPGKHSFACQIEHFKNAKKIIGIRGAEWANLIWANNKNLKVKIIDPQPPASILINFLTRLNIIFEFSFHNDFHIRYDPKEVESFLSST